MNCKTELCGIAITFYFILPNIDTRLPFFACSYWLWFRNILLKDIHLLCTSANIKNIFRMFRPTTTDINIRNKSAEGGSWSIGEFMGVFFKLINFMLITSLSNQKPFNEWGKCIYCELQVNLKSFEWNWKAFYLKLFEILNRVWFEKFKNAFLTTFLLNGRRCKIVKLMFLLNLNFVYR